MFLLGTFSCFSILFQKIIISCKKNQHFVRQSIFLELFFLLLFTCVFLVAKQYCSSSFSSPLLFFCFLFMVLFCLVFPFLKVIHQNNSQQSQTSTTNKKLTTLRLMSCRLCNGNTTYNKHTT